MKRAPVRSAHSGQLLLTDFAEDPWRPDSVESGQVRETFHDELLEPVHDLAHESVPSIP